MFLLTYTQQQLLIASYLFDLFCNSLCEWAFAYCSCLWSKCVAALS